jgi:hypothetical protein
MPPSKKTKTKKKNPRTEEDENISPIDIQYNPDIVDGLLQDIETQVDARCAQIKKDIDFMTTSVQQAFHLELIKLPNQVKHMTLRRFREEYGDSLEAVTRGTMQQSSSTVPESSKKIKSNAAIFQTPSSGRSANNLTTPARPPREGEFIVSRDGSPLGQFSTAVKAPRAGNNSIIPPTPGVFVPLDSGDVIDINSVESLPDELKEDAVRKMQDMMLSMQSLMAKIQKA